VCFAHFNPTHEGNHDMKLLQAKQQPYVKATKASDEDLPVFALNRAAKRKAFAANNPRSVRKARK
jgi:hypothetical protein